MNLKVAILIRCFSVLLLIFIFYSCSPAPRYNSSSIKNKKQIAKKVSKRNTSKFNKETTIYEGVASYYGPNFHGKLTANGEVYDKDGISAAHKTLPLNSLVKVTNIDNGKSVTLRINDRGPYIKGRILDCSYGAAKKLDFVNEGTTEVKVEVIKWGDNEYKK